MNAQKCEKECIVTRMSYKKKHFQLILCVWITLWKLWFSFGNSQKKLHISDVDKIKSAKKNK